MSVQLVTEQGSFKISFIFIALTNVAGTYKSLKVV